MLLVAGAMIAGAAAGVAVPQTAAAAPTVVAAQAECSASFVEFDPDEGAGEGWSRCGEMSTGEQRVVLRCSGYFGYYEVYGYWVAARYYSSTTCVGGAIAVDVWYERR